MVVQSSWRGYRINALRPDYVLDVWPTDDYPRGREALELSDLWAQISTYGIPGVLLLGCDVAADPDDYAAMCTAADRRPDLVHTGLVKLWPAATKRREWMWSHRGGTLGNPVASQDDIIFPTYFSLGFVYVPGQLLDLAFPKHSDWKWGEMDVGLSEIAISNGIRLHVVYDARPKHVHFLPEHNL